MPELDVVQTGAVRFAKVVAAAGKPEPYTLWTDPAHDGDFQKAVRQQRVMTIVRQRSKTDVALVGYLEKHSASYLLFPKTLKEFANKRVVGVKYELLTQSKPRGKPVKLGRKQSVRQPPRLGRTTSQTSAAPTANKRRAPSAPSYAATFRVSARILFVSDRDLEILAKNQHAARERALELLKKEPIDPAQGSKEVRIRKIIRRKE